MTMFSPSSERAYTGSPSSPGAEPMNLGSPVSSPSSLNNSLNFLPSYLIRDTGSSPPSFSQQTSWNTPVKHQSFQSQMSPALARKSLYQSPTSSNLLGSSTVTKSGGPPVQGLFDSLTSPKAMHGGDFSKVENTSEIANLSHNGSYLYSGVLTPSQSFTHNNSTYMSPAQIDPFYTQGEALTSETQLDEAWVTVYGFPLAATSFILQQFSQYGKIVEHKTATSGNWIHIKYQSKLQAKKALSKNGKIFGDIMVGVKPCIEMDIMNETGKENTNQSISPENVETLDSSKKSLQGIRPLTQIYKTPGSETETTPKMKTQLKANSLVSKAMEYVLNW